MSREMTVALAADTHGLSGLIAQVQTMCDDGTIDRMADEIAARQAAAGGSDDNGDAMRDAVMALDLVVFNDGTFDVMAAGDAHYAASDPRWVQTIPCASIVSAMQAAAALIPLTVRVVN